MKRIISILIVSSACLLCSCQEQQPLIEPDVKTAVEAGDIYRTTYVDAPTLPLNQGNGCFGSSYSQLGLHVHPSLVERDHKYGETHLMHIEHWIRAKFGADYLLPLARIYWENPFEAISDYSQHQSFYDGTIETAFTADQTRLKIMTWFDACEKDLSATRIHVTGDTHPTIVVEPQTIMKLHYAQQVEQIVNITQEEGNWKISLNCQGKEFVFYIRSNADVRAEENKLHFTLKEGDNYILLSYKAKSNTSVTGSLEQTRTWWHQKWNEIAVVQFSDSEAQRMWIRSMALFLSTFGNEKLGLAPPTGFAGNSWPFPYPQDLSYIHPVLLQTGNVDIAKSWIEYFAERIEGMKAYTKRLLGVDGILSPWVFPYGNFEGYHDPTPPNKFYYEIHNTGYMARMAYETSLFVNDEVWTRKYVWPLIIESARFYRSICSKEADGYWHLFVTPSMGQDERGGFNQKDYLCALYSAKYCFQKAIACGLDENGEYNRILQEGLAFAPLKGKEGFYYSCAGSGPDDFGKQKHPVQLNELAFLPTETEVSPEALKSYNLRYESTKDAKKPYFYGWTLGEFLLAGSRMGDTEGWQKDWNNMLKSNYVDKDFIQIYETSKTYNMTFYNTTNGLIAQSLLNNLICEWYNKLEIGKCLPWKGRISFRNLYSKLGVKIAGSIENGKAILQLEAWKNTDFMLSNEHIILRKGETTKKVISLDK